MTNFSEWKSDLEERAAKITEPTLARIERQLTQEQVYRMLDEADRRADWQNDPGICTENVQLPKSLEILGGAPVNRSLGRDGGRTR